MQNTSAEQVSLGIKLQYVLLQAGLSHLLKYRNSFIVFLVKGFKVRDFQKTLIHHVHAVFTLVVIRRLSVVLHSLIGLVIALVHLGNFLFQLGSVGEAAHVTEDRDGLLVEFHSLVHVRLPIKTHFASTFFMHTAAST